MPLLRFLRLWFAAILTAAAPLCAVEVTEGPAVAPAERSAVVRWTTDGECGASAPGSVRT